MSGPHAVQMRSLEAVGGVVDCCPAGQVVDTFRQVSWPAWLWKKLMPSHALQTRSEEAVGAADWYWPTKQEEMAVQVDPNVLLGLKVWPTTQPTQTWSEYCVAA